MTHRIATGTPWLPMPETWRALTVEVQTGDTGSVLELYRSALRLRQRGDGFAWRESPDGTLVFERREMICAVNVSAPWLDLPDGELLLASEPGVTTTLPPNTAAWLKSKGTT